MAEAKITPAMREWLRLIGQGRASYQLVRDGQWLNSRGSSSRGVPTRPTVRKLEAAGLIFWAQGHDPREQTAMLTAAGMRAIAGVPVAGKASDGGM